MTEPDLFLTARPAYPWSEYPLGPPALAAFAVLLVAATVWTYLGRRPASRPRVLAVLGLRLAALAVAVLTAVRPSVGVREEPKVPSALVIGVDVSESMTVADEIGGRTRIDAVREALDRCRPVLDELKAEQNVDVAVYGFGSADFAEPAGRFDPAAPAAAQQSDYGRYLARTLDRWQGERFLRGHLVIGDGADTADPGAPVSAAGEAGRWRAAGCPVHTFVAGTTTTAPDAKDVAVVAVAADPAPVPIKQPYVLKAVVNAFGFPGAQVRVKVQVDDGSGYKDAATEPVVLARERDNEVRIPLKAPDRPGELKVRVEVPADQVRGDLAPANNAAETYLTVTKEGVRVLYVDRLGWEHAAVRRALAADRRIDVTEVIRQTADPPTPAERAAFDLADNAYDVMIVGNVSAAQLTAVDPGLPAAIADRVRTQGMGLLFTGGYATFQGAAGVAGAGGWAGVPAVADLLPVDLTRPGSAPPADAPGQRFQYLPTARQAGHFLNRLGPSEAESLAAWARLNDRPSRTRFTGLSRMGPPLPTATVYAVAGSDGSSVPLPVADADAGRRPPLLVGHQVGAGGRGRVLCLAAQDTYLWQRLGQPEATDGRDLHSRFWRQLVLWLAHQDVDDGAAFARPEYRRLPVRGRQAIAVGLRGPGGAGVVDPTFEVKVVAPGESEQAAPARPVVPDPGGGFRVPFEPPVPGEYTVKLTAKGKTAAGADVSGDATARFLAYPEVSSELLRTAADPDFLRAVAAAGGGQFRRLDDLERFLNELKSSPPPAAKPKPRYLPDWRRNHSGGFLPAWLAVFVAVVGAEWTLRRLWGMA